MALAGPHHVGFVGKVVVDGQPLDTSAARNLGYLQAIEGAGVTVLEGVCFYILQNLTQMRVANGWTNMISNSAKIVNIIGAHRFNTILRRTRDCVEIACTGKLA